MTTVSARNRGGRWLPNEQGIIVAEAMKMENELRAPGPGTVRELRAPEGSLVTGGAPLVIIE